MSDKIREALQDIIDTGFVGGSQLKRALAALAQAERQSPQSSLEWDDCPKKTEYGAGMMEAFVELSKDETMRLVAHKKALPLVPAALSRLVGCASRTGSDRMKSAKTIIHVNQHQIRANLKKDAAEPVITVKMRGRKVYGYAVTIDGPSRMVYSPNKPLSCGARVWIETDAPVTVDGVPFNFWPEPSA